MIRTVVCTDKVIDSGFLTPVLYYTNTWYSKYMPISSTGSFDNTGSPYNVTQILTEGTFDEEKYKGYSPLFLSTTFALSYGLSFASVTGELGTFHRVRCQ